MVGGKALLTTRELADAIGTSESSLRRWIDAGSIHVTRTAGGHRRIPVAEAIRFIRQIGATVVRPDLLGLAELRRQRPKLAGLPEHQKLFETLRAGDRHLATGMLVSWYLDGESLHSLFDGPMRQAMSRIGELWSHDPRGILVEHRATAICIEAVALLAGLLPPPDSDAPFALGGAPQQDPYQLPAMMAGAVLSACGFRAANFGAATPVELLGREAVERNARLVWLSITTPANSNPLRDSIDALARTLSRRNIQLVLGGRSHSAYLPRAGKNAVAVGSMTELAAFAQGLRRSVAAGASSP